MANLSINVTINNQQVAIPVGSTILEAAKKIGVFIPTLCHDRELTMEASCRICVVEVEGWKNLPVSCATKVKDGMVIYTESAPVVEARKTILELLLANHPEDCLTCGKTGDCSLQDYAFRYGVRRSSFHGERHNYPIDDCNPFILRDMNKCIMCSKCVRVCAEVQGNNVLDFAFRGIETKVTTAMDVPLNQSECVFCGNCVSVCPVGALQEKDLRSKARTWEVKKVKTTCPYCGVGCNFELNVKNDTVIGVTSCNGEVNGRSLCVKGRFGYSFIHHPDRLTHPLIKRNGQFEPATWDEAIHLVARKLQGIKQNHSADALAVLSSARCTNEENYLLQKFTRAVLGTNNIDHCARLCHAPTVAGLRKSFGSGAMTNNISEISGADYILIIGSNTTETHPIIGTKVKQALRKGAQLAVIDPRVTEVAKLAHHHLQLNIGTDIALLNGFAHIIVEEGLWDRDFVANRTEGFKAYRQSLAQYTPEFTERITGVKAGIIRQVARDYAQAKRASILYTMGITQHTSGTDNVLAVANLALLCGHIGKEHTGVNPLRGQNNVQGACDMGALPDVLPGYQQVNSETVRNKFTAAWQVENLPANPGLTVGEMMDAAHAGTIKGMYIMGENPVLADADSNHVKAALQNLDFLVVQDIFLSETAQLADIVLPATSFAEKDGTFTNTERRVQLVRQAIEPVGEAKADWQIICLLGSAMGYPMCYQSPAAIMKEVASLTPSYGGITHQRLEKGGLQWPCPDINHPGTAILHQDTFAIGLGKFQAVEHKPATEQTDSEFPLLLTTGRRLCHYHTGTMTLRTDLKKHFTTDHLEVNPLDAENLKLTDGVLVQVSSRRGSIKLPVKITKVVPPGTVFTSFHFPSVPVNQLTNGARDSVAKIPELKVCAVKIELA